MLRQIRKGVFETNSSSVHTFILCREPIPSYVHFPSSIHFTYGEFGWEQEYYDDTFNKAAYLYTALTLLYSQEKAQTIIKELLSPVEVVCYFEKKHNDKWYESGYIDHVDECNDFIAAVTKNTDALCKYLFDSRSYIHTGNDNTDDDFEVVENYKYDLVEKWN